MLFMLPSRFLQGGCSEIGNGGIPPSYSCCLATRALGGNIELLVALEELILYAMRNPSICGPQLLLQPRGINRSFSFLFLLPISRKGPPSFQTFTGSLVYATPREGPFPVLSSQLVLRLGRKDRKLTLHFQDVFCIVLV